MKKINVLHFSDLHLKYDNDVDYNSFFEEISNCVREINKDIHVITITGDMVDKGNVSDFTNFHKKFIEPISHITKCPLNNIFCVAGNHDAERDDNINKLRNEYEKDANSGTHFQICKNEIRKVFSRFEDFAEFNKLLHPSQSTQKSYGATHITVNDVSIALIGLNSAIYSHDENDYRKLGLSKIQLDELVKEYKAIRENNHIDIAIALMHHPDDWLRNDEREYLWNYFTSKDKLPIDIILHGHIHESRIAGKIDLDSFVLSLVTGTTYESGKKEEKSFTSCRFALYEINVDEKEIQGKLFITNSKGKFVPDTSSYNSVNNDGCFSIPYSKDAFANKKSLQFPVPVNNHIAISDEQTDIFDEMVSRLWDFEKSCRLQLDAFSSVPKTEFDKDNNAIIKDWFFHIASCARNCLFDTNEINNVRTHFRIYDNKKGEHVHFCATIGERQITPIQWKSTDNLIFHSFSQKRSLVKSLNSEISFDTQGEWDDFLTVPVFDKFNGNEIPTYSFGISIKGNNNFTLSKKLEILSFLRIESLIDSIYASFRRRYLA